MLHPWGKVKIIIEPVKVLKEQTGTFRHIVQSFMQVLQANVSGLDKFHPVLKTKEVLNQVILTDKKVVGLQTIKVCICKTLSNFILLEHDVS